MHIKKIFMPPATNVYIGHQVLNEDSLTQTCASLKPIIVVDEGLTDLYLAKCPSLAGLEVLKVPGGESSKSWEVAERIIYELLQRGYARDTAIIAFGGGSITDLVGFIGSIYMRGLSTILIPTTLLAMVDAAIGGKTAINLPLAKNLLGTIHFPKAIFVDLELLQTLPRKEFLNGLAEIIKMGLIYDASILHHINHSTMSESLVLQAIQGKIAIVQKDPTDKGIRRILNFGHTIGHALEAISQYSISHGEAVVLGCLVEAHLSYSLGYLSEKELLEIIDIFNYFSPKLPSQYGREKLLKAMLCDKKCAQDQIRFVCLEKIGKASSFDGQYCRAVSKKDLLLSLDWMEKYYG